MILYTRHNDRRKPEFRLTTVIEQRGQERIVRKLANSPTARPFLFRLLDNYRTLTGQPLPFQILPASKGTDCVAFPYQEGTSLDTELLTALKRRDREGLLRLFREHQRLIDTLPSSTGQVSPEFQTIFGESSIGNCQNVTLGLLDIAFDNLLRTSSGWTVIDYEWLFPFPIPARYLHFRAVVGWYRNALQHYPWRVIALPELLERQGLPESEWQIFARWEEAFQTYVTGRPSSFLSEFQLMTSASHGEELLRSALGVQEFQTVSLRKAALEDECHRQHAWIVNLEEICRNKDAWIAKLERDISELKSAVEHLSGNHEK